VEVPFTPSAKSVLVEAVEEARKLSSNAICTAHILLALVQEKDGNTAKVLEKLNVDPKKIPE
ncbi:unnamed protein product, partial [Prorocentrum cordatum]